MRAPRGHPGLRATAPVQHRLKRTPNARLGIIMRHSPLPSPGCASGSSKSPLRASPTASFLGARLGDGRKSHAIGSSVAPSPRRDAPQDSEADVVVIGSGIGGLCAASLLSRYGLSVTVLESHYLPGGCAHSWEQDGYTFEAGPSTWASMTGKGTPNPLGQVLQAVGEEVDFLEYNDWGLVFPEPVGRWTLTIDGTDRAMETMLADRFGPGPVEEYRALREQMGPIAEAAMSVPVAALRFDIAGAYTLARFIPGMMGVLPAVGQLMKPYTTVMDSMGVKNQFLRDWLDLSCFMLSGAPASGTPASLIGAVFNQWFKPGSCMQYPVGGSAAVVDALVRGVTKRPGGRVQLRAHVEEVLVEGGRAAGVRLRGGEVVRARKAVISNASCWDTLCLVPESEIASGAGREWADAARGTDECHSFMHLHLGIDAAGLPPGLRVHYTVVEDWGKGVDAEDNVFLISIPSVIDPSLAPEGKHAVHVYTPGAERWARWAGVERGTPEYEVLKEERAGPLWAALQQIIPDIKDRVEVEMVGTPLTHKRFLRRHNGSYGGRGWVEKGEQATINVETGVPGLLAIGDSCFPGPGLPAVAAGGVVAAHSLVPFWQQCEVIDEVLP